MTRLRFAPVLLLAFLTACGDGGVAPEPDPPTATTPSEVVELDQVRAQVGPAAVDVGTAITQLDAAVAALRDDVDAVSVVRDAAAAVQEAADGLTTAGQRAGAFPEVVTSSDAVVEAARGMARAAGDAAEGIAVGERRREQLVDLVDRWGDDASRRVQLERLGEVEEELRALAAMTPAAPKDCAGAEAGWLAAAEDAADVTTMLLDAVADTDGLRFDELRAEGRAASGVQAPVDSSAATCPALGVVDEQAERVLLGLDEVEAALNPADLVDG